jgi:hypothetical protein
MFGVIALCVAFSLFGDVARASAAVDGCHIHVRLETLTVTECVTPLGLGYCQIFFRIRYTDGDVDHFGGAVPCKTGNGVSPDSRRPFDG